MKFGYACINLTLSSEGIIVNKGMIKKTFISRGITYASELALENIRNLEKIVDWNIENKFLFYRMSSDMFPWMSEYELEQLPDIPQIKTILKRVGEKAKIAGLRLTFHPGPFHVLASPNKQTLENTIKGLSQHGQIMDYIGLPHSPYAKINIHVGGAYGDKTAAMNTFCENFKRLPDAASKRLTVENDDKANMFSIKDLLYIHQQIGIPLVFDYLHHLFCTGGLSIKEAFELAYHTWPKGITPVVHYSSPKKDFEDFSAPGPAHADFIYDVPPIFGKEVDIMFEAKAKEMAIFKFKEDFSALI
jgi:UV DNA damage endonuclease